MAEGLDRFARDANVLCGQHEHDTLGTLRPHFLLRRPSLPKKLIVKMGTKMNLANGPGAVRVVLPWFCPRHPQAHEFFGTVFVFAGSGWFCGFCFAFARSCWFCLTFDTLLLVLHSFRAVLLLLLHVCAVLLVLHSSACSAPRLRDPVRSASL